MEAWRSIAGNLVFIFWSLVGSSGGRLSRFLLGEVLASAISSLSRGLGGLRLVRSRLDGSGTFWSIRRKLGGSGCFL